MTFSPAEARWACEAGGAENRTTVARGAGARLSIKAAEGRGGTSACASPLGGARDSREPRPQPPAEWPERAMELEPGVLLQEARENVEAAQSYRRELGQRLQGLREARSGGTLVHLERPENLHLRGPSLEPVAKCAHLPALRCFKCCPCMLLQAAVSFLPQADCMCALCLAYPLIRRWTCRDAREENIHDHWINEHTTDSPHRL
ncbi:uncharacterized protein LOC130683228 [Manis pentadactyla]|uniref:uncharacterized protein LOC130683228 n=1 Tax=Manis pentadactyla TaxID=143292 RepID=UPI00255C4BBD|nr:uncharacterized protein LOC130683228 [Manis pentadactyla]